MMVAGLGVAFWQQAMREVRNFTSVHNPDVVVSHFLRLEDLVACASEEYSYA